MIRMFCHNIQINNSCLRLQPKRKMMKGSLPLISAHVRGEKVEMQWVTACHSNVKTFFLHSEALWNMYCKLQDYNPAELRTKCPHVEDNMFDCLHCVALHRSVSKCAGVVLFHQFCSVLLTPFILFQQPISNKFEDGGTISGWRGQQSESEDIFILEGWMIFIQAAHVLIFMELRWWSPPPPPHPPPLPPIPVAFWGNNQPGFHKLCCHR